MVEIDILRHDGSGRAKGERGQRSSADERQMADRIVKVRIAVSQYEY